MQQGSGMNELDHSGQVEALLALVTECPTHQQQQSWPQTLAASSHDVTGNLTNQGDI